MTLFERMVHSTFAWFHSSIPKIQYGSFFDAFLKQRQHLFDYFAQQLGSDS